MPSNEREIKRKEKQRQKDIKSKKIIWIILILILSGLLIMKVCELDFNSIKETIYSSVGISKASEDIYPYSLEDFDSAELSIINDKLNILTNSSLLVLNPADAKKIYNFDHNYSNPVLSYAGSYICIIDQGGTRLRLDTTANEKFEKSTEKRIITADVSRNGTVAYATLSDHAKSSIFVLNKSSVKKMSYDVNDGYVTQVAVNPAGNKLTFSTVNSENAKLVTTIHTIDVGAEKETSAFQINQSQVYDLKYGSSDDCYVVCDDALYCLNSQKELNEVFKQGTVSIFHYAYSNDNKLIIDYGNYADSQENEIAYVHSNGKVKTKIKQMKRIKGLSSSSNKITVLFDDKIKVYSLTNGEEKYTCPCRSDASCAYTLSSKQFILHGQYIDLIEQGESYDNI